MIVVAMKVLWISIAVYKQFERKGGGKKGKKKKRTKKKKKRKEVQG